VVSWPPWAVWDEVNPAYTLSASWPLAQRPPSESIYMRNGAAGEPNRVGEPKMTASAHTMSAPGCRGQILGGFLVG